MPYTTARDYAARERIGRMQALNRARAGKVKTTTLGEIVAPLLVLLPKTLAETVLYWCEDGAK